MSQAAQESPGAGAVAVVPGHGPDPAHNGEPDVISVSGPMVFWTLLVFAGLVYVLGKYAWKPILGALDKREAGLRQAVVDARKLKAELAEIEDVRQRTADEAKAEAKAIVADARKAAVEAGRVIQAKAREESQILLENAQREIKTATERARADLRRESADLAVQIASALVEDSLDEKRGRELADKLIGQV